MSSKIKHGEEITTECIQKRLKTDDSQDTRLSLFLDWCKRSGIFIDYDKVKISYKNTSHNYGMIAIKDLNENTCLVRIPKDCLLSLENTSLKENIEKNELKSESNWARLVVALMFELEKGKQSKWQPYLTTFPNYDDLDLPMFWPKLQFEELLKNTCIKSNVDDDLKNMKNEFESIIVPFMKKNQKCFSERCFDFNYYKNLVAFIMAYSFTDPNENPEDECYVGPKMVPVADILNHVAKNNAEIRFTPHELQIFATKNIKSGEEVYNTYGEHSNADLLHMYGFVEEYAENIHDNVEIMSEFLIQTMRDLKNNPDELLEKKIDVFLKLDLIGKSSFIVSNDGILNEEELLQLLQIYTMTRGELEDFIETDYELEEDEEQDYSLSKDNLKSIPLDWKHLLIDSCKLQMQVLENDLVQHEKSETNSIEERRITKVKNLKKGHIRILKEFLSLF